MAYASKIFKPVIVPLALRENNALQLANQSARYIGHKPKPYNKKY